MNGAHENIRWAGRPSYRAMALVAELTIYTLAGAALAPHAGTAHHSIATVARAVRPRTELSLDSRMGRTAGSRRAQSRVAALPVAASPVSEAWSQRVFADLAAREYEASEDGSGFEAPNRAQGLRSRFTSSGVSIRPRLANGSAWEWQWRTARWGRDRAMLEGRDVAPTACGRRVTYARDGISEWYENRPDGIEQGFTIAERPCGSGELRIEGRAGGELAPAPQRSGASFVFRNGAGVSVLGYGGLAAFDEQGTSLPARWSLDGTTICIRVDDRAAAYPITIDPIVASSPWVIEGDQDSCHFGAAIATAGDVNGDGFSDVIVGAPDYDGGLADAGRAFVFLGDSAGLTSTPAWIQTGTRIRARFGTAVAAAGDVNRDGFGDVIVGAPGFDDGTHRGGAAYLYLGSETGLVASPAWTAFKNPIGAGFGGSVATAGDVNGDLRDDVIIGASLADSTLTDEGQAYVYLGTAAGLAAAPQWSGRGAQVGAHFGTSVSTAGDVNGDGYADVIVGAPFYSDGNVQEGAAFVYLGDSTGVAANAAKKLECNADSASFGMSVSTAGDVNGDGYCEVLVGAPGFASRAGRAFVFMGSSAGLATVAAWARFTGVPGDQYGFSVATAGDVNGDGYADVIVGAPGADATDPDMGIAYVYEGSSTGLSSGDVWQSYGEHVSASAHEQFGGSVATAGDVNGDGFSDILVGSPGHDLCADCAPHLHDAGSAWLFLGAPAGLALRSGWSTESNTAGVQLGFSVASAHDVNGDGFGDVIVGAPFWDVGGTDAGAAFVYLGSDTGLTTTVWDSVVVHQAGAHCGWSVASPGDVDGDGFSDIVVGAPLWDGGFTDQGLALVRFGGKLGIVVHGVGDSLTIAQAGAHVGWSVSGAGDVNGDGYADVIVGAPGWSGAHVSQGAALLALGGGALGTPQAIQLGASGQDSAQFGYAVADAGDVNGDGLAEFLVGSPLYDTPLANAGRAYMFTKSDSLHLSWSANGPTAGAQFGEALVSAGDVDGDGFGDVVVGAAHYSAGLANRGEAVVFTGSATGLGLSPAWAVQGNVAGARAGSALASTDVNSDGYSDVIVGAPGASSVPPAPCTTPAISAYPGSASGLSLVPTWSACLAGAAQGVTIATHVDVNGDGFPDVLAGTPQLANGQSNEGGVSLFYGNGGAAIDGHGGRGLSRARGVTRDDTTQVDVGGRTNASTCAHLAMLLVGAGGGLRGRIEGQFGPAPTDFGICPRTDPSCRADTSSGQPAAEPTPQELRAKPVLVQGCGLTPDAQYRYLVRVVQYSPLFPHSPWFSSPYVARTAAMFRTQGLVGVAPGGASAAGTLCFAAPLPNPARGNATLDYTLPHAGAVRLVIRDIAGRQVALVVDGRQGAGRHLATWDARGPGGRAVMPGMYYASLSLGGETVTRKILELH